MSKPLSPSVQAVDEFSSQQKQSQEIPAPKKHVKRSIVPKTFRLLDFHIYDENPTSDDNLTSSSSSSSSNEDEEYPRNKIRKDKNVLKIQMFGINETGETCSLFITNYKPFFYIKVGETWTQNTANSLLADIRSKVGSYYESSILSGKLIQQQKLYGFSGGKEFNFVEITFKNIATMNRVKNLWYEYVPIDGVDPANGTEKRKRDYFFPPSSSRQSSFGRLKLELYESGIPPLLRYFHIHNISPSGWVSIPNNKIFKPATKSTTCQYEYICRVEDITPLPLKEERVPYKICSFDIEASSSHGDFPVPKKTYKKLATNIIDSIEKYKKQQGFSSMKTENVSSESKVTLSVADSDLLKKKIKLIIMIAFGYSKPKEEEVDLVYPKVRPLKADLENLIIELHNKSIEAVQTENMTEEKSHLLKIDVLFNKFRHTETNDEEVLEEGHENTTEFEEFDDEEDSPSHTRPKKTKQPATPSPVKETTIQDIIIQPIYKRDEKIQKLNEVLTLLFPTLEGDKTTFIGSTFLKYGEPEPYLNHCIVLGSCSPVDNATIVSVNTEKELLLKWTEIIQTENPDIIIGYNIFNFDYEFMFRRAEENDCEHAFLKLSRKKGEISAKEPSPVFGGFPSRTTPTTTPTTTTPPQKSLVIENSKIVLASGEYDLRYYKMTGRLQIDMLYYLRRDFNLASYKLDDVVGLYISDEIKKVVWNETNSTMELYSNNITGLHINDYIHIETTKFTTDYYKDGMKFQIVDIERNVEWRESIDTPPKITNKIIIRGNEPELVTTKGIKWCIAKDDVTPQDIFRLTNGTAEDRAIVAKYCIQDCNLVHHLMRKIDVLTGYVEMSSICSVPISFLVFRGQGIKLTSFVAKKCREKNTLMPDIEKSNTNDGYEGAIVLPPKCGIYTDNPVACVDYSSLYPSSMISQNLSHDSKVWTKEYNLEGELVRFIGDERYDNMEGYQYIDIEFDTYKYIRNPEKPSSKAEKTKVGKMICRWAQFPDNKKGIMPSILEELLKARSSTRKLMKTERDPFMQNILDKRQLGYKVTANSLYGQCGSKTSTFYEKDVAASTTATGRMMIIYAKNVIEDVYGDRIYNTKSHGLVHTKAEYIYGDSVAKYTPIYVRVSCLGQGQGKLYICNIEDLANQYKVWVNAPLQKWQICKEPGKEEKEYFEFDSGSIETWTEEGWTKLNRIIRHKLGKNKKMVRVITKTGLIDVTEDHSLIHSVTKKEIRPKDCVIGTPLLHNNPPTLPSSSISFHTSERYSPEEARIMGYFYGNGDCCHYNLTSFLKRRYWLLKNLTSENSIIYLNLCKQVYPDYEWVLALYDENSQEKKYVLYPKYPTLGSNENTLNDLPYEGKLRTLIKKYNMELYVKVDDVYAKDKRKVIPLDIITANYEVREAFWKGFMDTQSSNLPSQATEKPSNVQNVIKCKDQFSASCLCSFISSINYQIYSIQSLNGFSVAREGKFGEEYEITICREPEDENQIKIVEMIPLSTLHTDYVYDLTTENHHFAAGIGNIIAHNTDSVFFTFNLEDTETKEKIRGKQALEITIEIAQDAAKLCSQWLKSPMELSYEKTLMPFILLSKKRYVGMLYETDSNKGYMKYMGLSIKRRDSCDYLKDVYGGILNILLKEHDILKSIEFLDESLTRLINGNVSMDKLMISKSLRSDYKNPNQIAHKVLADRIGQREPGNKPKPGDRIKFVHFVNKNSNKPLQGEKIETPEFIIANRLTIDYSFYITNQLMKPIQQLFGLAVEEIMELRKTSTRQLKIELKELEKACGDDLDTLSKKREKICSQRVKKLLFDKYLTQITNENNGFRYDLLNYFH